jgi:hypothetical protein
MLAEAKAFAPVLSRFEAAAARYHAAVQRFVGAALPPLMAAPLPRIWERVHGGLAEPVRTQISHGHPAHVGGRFDAALLRAQLEQLEARLDGDVLRPLRRWHEGLAVVKVCFFCCCVRARLPSASAFAQPTPSTQTLTKQRTTQKKPTGAHADGRGAAARGRRSAPQGRPPL